tara:strand:- start:2124 stop:2234 length:111 start_codon:yes stop_codon:yes gene_type:complete
MSRLPKVIFMAQEMGAGLGTGEVLLGALSSLNGVLS